MTTRRSTPAAGVEEFTTEPATGVLEGDELAAARSQRQPEDRIGRLEVKHDKLVETVGGLRESVAGMSGKMDTVLDFIKGDREQQHVTKRARFMSRDKVIVGVVSALCTGIAAIVVAIVSQGCS